MPAIKVLMADDEEGMLEIMARKVSDAGYGVVTARDGKSAWEKIQAEEPDVIILDVTMPNLNGWEVLRRVRSNPAPKKWQPVIIVSALGQADHLKDGMKLEADHYILKPCRIEDVIKSIRLMVSLIPMRYV